MSKVGESLVNKTDKSRAAEKEEDESKEELEPICLLFPTYATKHLDGNITFNTYMIVISN